MCLAVIYLTSAGVSATMQNDKIKLIIWKRKKKLQSVLGFLKWILKYFYYTPYANTVRKNETTMFFQNKTN